MSFSWFLVGALAGAGGMYVAAKEKVWKPNPTETIAEVDLDEAEYVGDEQDGVYVQAAQGPDGMWYVSTVVDSNTGNFVDSLETDDGPYGSYSEAMEAGKGTAAEWCIDNGVDFEEADDDESEQYEYPDENEMMEAAVISDVRGRYNVQLASKFLGTFDDFGEAIEAVNHKMDQDRVWANVYHVNDHGNIDLVNQDGEVLASWV